MNNMAGLHAGAVLTNEEYHENDTHYSSSQIKDAVTNIEYFHKKYITKEIVDKITQSPALLIGTYLHTAILEPENLEKECVVFGGAKRTGKAWDIFKEEHAGKTILTKNDMEKAQILVESANGSPRLMELLVGGMAELSLFHTLQGLNCKVRADYINFEEGYILDLKSTAKNAKNEYEIQSTIEDFNYDMSAAYYLDLFNAYLGDEGKPLIETYYWGFVSKSTCNAKVWEASKQQLATGRAKYMNGIAQIHKYAALKWDFPDEISVIEPLKWVADKWLSSKKVENKTRTKVTPVRLKKSFDLL